MGPKGGAQSIGIPFLPLLLLLLFSLTPLCISAPQAAPPATNDTNEANQRVDYNYVGFLDFGIDTFFIPIIYSLSLLVLEDANVVLEPTTVIPPPEAVPPVATLQYRNVRTRTRVKQLVEALEYLAGQIRIDAVWKPLVFIIYANDIEIGDGDISLLLGGPDSNITANNAGSSLSSISTARRRVRDLPTSAAPAGDLVLGPHSAGDVAVTRGNVEFTYSWIYTTPPLDQAKIFNMLAILLAEQLPFTPSAAVHSFVRRKQDLGVQIQVVTAGRMMLRMTVGELVGALWFMTDTLWRLGR